MKLFLISVVGHYSTIGPHSAYIMTASVYLIKKKKKKKDSFSFASLRQAGQLPLWFLLLSFFFLFVCLWVDAKLKDDVVLYSNFAIPLLSPDLLRRELDKLLITL